MDTASVLIEAVGRWAVYLAALPLIGLVSWRLLLWPRLPAATREARAGLDRRLGSLGVVIAVALLLALGVRALCQTANVFSPSAALDLDHLRTVVVESRWGGRFRWQVWSASTAIAAFAWVRVHARSGWILTALSALWLCVALPRTGHAMSHGALALGAQALHVLGAGLWVGTLAVAMGEGLWGTKRQWDRPSGELLHLFAPVAVAGAATLGGSGALSAYLYLPDLGSLWVTAWGRALLLKIVLVCVVGVLGYLNFRRFRRPAVVPASLRLAKIELLVALAVVLLTGLLTALPSPGD